MKRLLWFPGTFPIFLWELARMGCCKAGGRVYVAPADIAPAKPNRTGAHVAVKPRKITRFLYVPRVLRADAQVTFPGSGTKYRVGKHGELRKQE